MMTVDSLCHGIYKNPLIKLSKSAPREKGSTFYTIPGVQCRLGEADRLGWAKG